VRDLKRLFGYLRPYAGRVVVASILLAISGGLMSLIIATAKPLINEVLGPGTLPGMSSGSGEAPKSSGSGFDILEKAKEWLGVEQWLGAVTGLPFVAVPVLLVFFFFLRAVTSYFGGYLTAKTGAYVIRDVRAELHEAVTYQSLRFFQLHPTGLILSRILNDVGALQRLSTTVLAELVRVSAMIPFLLLVVLVHDWRMSVVALVGLPLLALPIVKLGQRLRRASTRQQERLAEVSSLLTETVMGARVVQGFTMERFEIKRFRDALMRMLRVEIKAIRSAALAPPILELSGAIVGAGLFYYAGRAIHRGKLDPGDFGAALFGISMLFVSVRKLNMINAEIQRGLAAATRIFSMIDRQREIRDLPGATPLPTFAREIRFSGVDFAYEKDEKVLDRVSLVVRKGEVVALVGASGSGKSTIANLIPRFYDPTAGAVTIDGHDLRAVTLISLREQIGLVSQETILFDDTVRNNIAYGRADVPIERVIEAAKAAHAHEFIERLPQGYDTRLGERGARLSMGQRQRITIARAILKDPPILVLDEATSALDSESETLVQAALGSLMKGRTSVVIAHRLATVRNADRILVMEAGRIIEEGTHRELIANGKVYARLYELQFQESPA
jgi:subfamily B ATP-binding cassette protein MsbA